MYSTTYIIHFLKTDNIITGCVYNVSEYKVCIYSDLNKKPVVSRATLFA